MSHPYGPDGQDAPRQPDLRPPPVISSTGAPQQPYSSAPGKPSGATGIGSAVLATLGGLSGFVVAVVGGIGGSTLVRLERPLGYVITTFAGVVTSVAFGAMLLAGAVLLFRRKMIGRHLVIAGSITAVASYALFFAGVVTSPDRHISAFGIGVTVVVACLFPIITLVLALLPSTLEWIRAKPNPLAAQQYSPFQG